MTLKDTMHGPDWVICVMALGQAVLPAWTTTAFAIITALDCAVILILAETWCKKK